MSQQLATLIQIGQLLTRAGLLTSEMLDNALNRARERDLPIGTILLTMGCLRQRELRAAVEAQSMVNDGLISSDLAADALARAAADGCTFDQAMKALGLQSKTSAGTNRLGQLLVDAGYISDTQLAECLTTSLETGLPLGRVLTFKRMLTDDLLLSSLKAQRMIREGALSRDIGVRVLSVVKEKKVSIEQSLTDSGVFKNKPKRTSPVGYLLVEAGFVSEVNLMTCVEMSLSEGKTVVELLVEQGLTVTSMARACMVIQRLVDDGTLSNELALEALHLVHDDGYSEEKAVAAVCLPEIDEHHKMLLQELCVLTGLTQAKQLSHLESAQIADFTEFAQVLGGKKAISDPLIESIARALYLIDMKMLAVEDAVMALYFARKNLVCLDDALSAMGWQPPENRKL